MLPRTLAWAFNMKGSLYTGAALSWPYLGSGPRTIFPSSCTSLVELLLIFEGECADPLLYFLALDLLGLSLRFGSRCKEDT